MALRVALPVLWPFVRSMFLAEALRTSQIAFENIFDAEKNVAEAGAAHQRGESLAVIRDGRGHGLHEIVDLVQSGGDDGLAQRLEPLDVQSDVVVDQKNGARAVIAGVANVGQHAVERVSMEVAAAHLDDRTEAAIEGAAARGLDYIHLPAEQRVSLEHARIAVRRADFLVFKPVRRPRGIMHPALAVPVRKATDVLDA